MITFGFNLLRLQQTCMNYVRTFEILYEAIKFHLVGTMNVSTKSMSSIQQMLRNLCLHQSGGPASRPALPSL